MSRCHPGLTAYSFTFGVISCPRSTGTRRPVVQAVDSDRRPPDTPIGPWRRAGKPDRPAAASRTASEGPVAGSRQLERSQADRSPPAAIRPCRADEDQRAIRHAFTFAELPGQVHQVIAGRQRQQFLSRRFVNRLNHFLHHRQAGRAENFAKDYSAISTNAPDEPTMLVMMDPIVVSRPEAQARRAQAWLAPETTSGTTHSTGIALRDRSEMISARMATAISEASWHRYPTRPGCAPAPPVRPEAAVQRARPLLSSSPPIRHRARRATPRSAAPAISAVRNDHHGGFDSS